MSGGARRPYLLTQALRDQGAEVFVVAPSLPEDEAGLAVPHPHRDPSPASVASPDAMSDNKSLRDHARDWLLWPDPDIRWTRRAAAAAARFEGKPPDWILTTSPPESVHAAGRMLKKTWPHLKWAADFRDHWLNAPHRRERLSWHRRFGERAIAKHWLASADVVACVDPFIAEELQSFGATSPLVLPHFAPPILPDPANLLQEAINPKTRNPETINIVHAGSIALSDPLANIADILRPFEVAISHNERLRLHFVGRLTHQEKSAIAASPAAPQIIDHDVQPYETALSFIAAADGLAYVASEKGKVPPSKIVEYLATNAPIIACGRGPWRSDPRVDNTDPATSFATLTKNAQRQDTLRPPSASEIATDLLTAFAACP